MNKLTKNINRLLENDGITMAGGKKVSYKKGYQVATEGVECRTVAETVKAVKNYNGDCGVWLYKGVYYVDKCVHILDRSEAIELGMKCNQISIFCWEDESLLYLKK